MARILQTGFEPGHMSIFDITSNQGTMNTSTTAGAWSAYSHSGGPNPDVISLASSVSEIYFGFRWRMDMIAPGYDVISFESPNATQNGTMNMTAGGKMEWRTGSRAGTLLGTGGLTFSINTWYYIEGHYVINDTTGSIETKVNGTVDIGPLTSQDTRNDAAANGDKTDRVRLGGFGGSNHGFTDDLYVNDTTGSRNIAYSGDIRVSAYIPNAAGDVTGMSRGGADSGSNYGQIDERPPNDATDYVAAAGTSLYDLYNIPNTSGVDTVQAVVLWLRAQKSDAGAKNVAHVLKYDTNADGTADTENVGSDVALSTTWAYYRKIYNDDPGAAAWNAQKIDALQVGAKAR